MLRADYAPVVVREGANVQDGAVLHAPPGSSRHRSRAMIGHNCVIHGANIGAGALIANNCTVLDGAVISLVAAHSLVLSACPDPG